MECLIQSNALKWQNFEDINLVQIEETYNKKIFAKMVSIN